MIFILKRILLLSFIASLVLVSFASAVLSPNSSDIKGYYKFDDNLLDWSTTGSHLAIRSGADVYTAGKVNRSLDCNADRFANVSLSFNVNTLRTVEYWVKFDSLSANSVPIHWSFEDNGDAWYYSAGAGLYKTYLGGVVHNIDIPSTGVWYHYVHFINLDGRYIVYRNGSVLYNASTTNVLDSRTSYTFCMWASGGDNLVGKMDNAIFYNSSPTTTTVQQWVNDAYNNGTGRDPTISAGPTAPTIYALNTTHFVRPSNNTIALANLNITGRVYDINNGSLSYNTMVVWGNGTSSPCAQTGYCGNAFGGNGTYWNDTYFPYNLTTLATSTNKNVTIFLWFNISVTSNNASLFLKLGNVPDSVHFISPILNATTNFSGVVAYYKFDNSLTDSSPLQINLTADFGSASYISGKLNNALDCDADSFISPAVPYNLSSIRVVEYWLNLNTLTANAEIVHMEIGDKGNEWYIYSGNEYKTGINTTYHVVESSLGFNSWRHYVHFISFDGNYYIVYKNGVKIYNATTGGDTIKPSSYFQLCNYAGYGQPLDGQIDNLIFYNSSPTNNNIQTWVNDAYNSGFGREISSAISYSFAYTNLNVSARGYSSDPSMMDSYDTIFIWANSTTHTCQDTGWCGKVSLGNGTYWNDTTILYNLTTNSGASNNTFVTIYLWMNNSIGYRTANASLYLMLYQPAYFANSTADASSAVIGRNTIFGVTALFDGSVGAYSDTNFIFSYYNYTSNSWINKSASATCNGNKSACNVTASHVITSISDNFNWTWWGRTSNSQDVNSSYYFLPSASPPTILNMTILNQPIFANDYIDVSFAILDNDSSYVNASITWYTNHSGIVANNNSFDYNFDNVLFNTTYTTGAGTGRATPNFIADDIWTAQLTANDGLTKVAQNQSVTIQRTEPKTLIATAPTNGSIYSHIANVTINWTLASEGKPDVTFRTKIQIVNNIFGQLVYDEVLTEEHGYIWDVALNETIHQGDNKIYIYACNSYGCSNNASINISVNDQPEIDYINISPVIAYNNDTLLGYVNSSHNETVHLINYSYQWYRNGVFLTSGYSPNHISSSYDNIANLSSSYLRVYDNISFNVTPCDHFDCGASRGVSSMISNRAMTAPVIASPLDFNSSGALTTWFSVYEPDGNITCDLNINGTLNFTNASVVDQTNTSMRYSPTLNNIYQYNVSCYSYSDSTLSSLNYLYLYDTTGPTFTNFYNDSLWPVFPQIGDTMAMNVTVSDTLVNVDGCILTMNDTLNGLWANYTTSTINANSGTASFTRKISENQTYNRSSVGWAVWCNDSLNNWALSTTQDFVVIDIALPLIELGAGSNFNSSNTSVISSSKYNATLNISVYDYNIFAISINVTCDDSGTIDYYELIDINATPYFSHYEIINLSNLPLQRCRVDLQASDDHTDEIIADYTKQVVTKDITYLKDSSKEVKKNKTDKDDGKDKDGKDKDRKEGDVEDVPAPISTTISTKGLSYTTEEKNNIEILSMDAADVENIHTTKEKDRYKFDFNFKTSKDKREFIVKSNNKIVSRENSAYPGHVVVWNSDTFSGNWIDFADDNQADYDYASYVIDENTYKLIISKKDGTNKAGKDSFKFKSIGGTTVTNATYWFYIGSTINVSTLNLFDNSKFAGFNVTATSSNTPLGTVSALFVVPGYSGLIENISNGTWSLAYRKTGYLSNTNTIVINQSNTTASNVWATGQAYRTVIARQVKTMIELNETNMTFRINGTNRIARYDTNSSTFAMLYLNATYYEINATSGTTSLNYSGLHSIVAGTNESLYLPMGFTATFHLIDERTLNAWDISKTNTTQFQLTCQNSTLLYAITSATQSIPIECDYEKFRFIITYGAGTTAYFLGPNNYYRDFILQPDAAQNINIYLIDRTTTADSQVDFFADDLLSQYNDMEIFLMRRINSTNVQITASAVAQGDKITAYLLQNYEYTIIVKSSNKPDYSPGTYTPKNDPTTSATSQIRLYTINANPTTDSSIANGVRQLFYYDNSTNYVVVQYNDTTNLTTFNQVNISQINADNSEILLQSTTFGSEDFLLLYSLLPANQNKTIIVREGTMYDNSAFSSGGIVAEGKTDVISSIIAALPPNMFMWLLIFFICFIGLLAGITSANWVAAGITLLMGLLMTLGLNINLGGVNLGWPMVWISVVVVGISLFMTKGGQQ